LDQNELSLITGIEAEIYRLVGGRKKFEVKLPALLRQAIDEVIDARRSGRFTLDELEKTEKTYLGTKIEILFRSLLGADRGKKLDLNIGGVEVDVKNTIGSQWTIPVEAVGHPCILIRTDESRALCWVGLLVIKDEYLGVGRNRDEKRGLSKEGRLHIRWLLHGFPYPSNFWERIDPDLRRTITAPRGGTERVAALFRTIQGTPLPRNVIEALAPQKDSLKRLRKNGGARDALARENIAVLWGRNDRELIQQLGLPQCSPDEFISFQASGQHELDLLRRTGRLPWDH
jgi:hypothetical protein